MTVDLQQFKQTRLFGVQAAGIVQRNAQVGVVARQQPVQGIDARRALQRQHRQVGCEQAEAPLGEPEYGVERRLQLAPGSSQ
jgi:hypothetical protein